MTIGMIGNVAAYDNGDIKPNQIGYLSCSHFVTI
jgi:hypothetical protein